MSEAVLGSLIAVSFEQFTWTYKTLGTSFSNTLYLFTNLYNSNREICNLFCNSQAQRDKRAFVSVFWFFYTLETSFLSR